MADAPSGSDVRSWVARGLLLLVVVPLCAAVCSAAASLVPNRMILDAVTDGVRRNAIVDLPQVGISGRGVDVFGDCIALTMGLGETAESRALDWLTSPTLGRCDRAIDSISRFDAAGGLTGGYEYFRYWHGYTIVSRPLLAAVGVTGTRIVLFWAILAALGVFARRLWRFHGAITAIGLVGTYLLTSDAVESARSLAHGVPLLVAVVGAWSVHRAAAGRDPIGDPGVASGRNVPLRLATVAFLAGSTYVFVDLLTTPPGAWALSICAAILATSRRDGMSRLARDGVVVGSAWIAGWAWTWASKWAIAAAFLGPDKVRESVGDAVSDRLTGERDYIDLGLLNATRVNVQAWLDHPLTPIALVLVVGSAVVAWKNPVHRATWRTRLVLAVPALVPPIWFEVLRNHSLVHVGFTYRSVAVSAGILAVALLVPLRALDPRSER